MQFYLNQTLKPNTILWLQVASLAIVQGAMTLAWIMYRLYLPIMLVNLGLTKEFAVGLLIVENILGMIMEPLFGGLSDRIERSQLTRFSLISLGVVLASAVFIALPVVVILTNPNTVGRLLLIGFALAWALTMTIFRSPVISLLAQSAPSTQLPLAASLLTFVGSLLGAFRPMINKFILNLGAVFTFSIGSFVLLGSIAFLRSIYRPVTPTTTSNDSSNNEEKLSFLNLGLILTTAMGIAWGSRLLMTNLGQVVNHDTNMLGIGILLAIMALPAGWLATKIGNQKALFGGLLALILALQIIVFLPDQFWMIIAIILIIINFSIVLNSAIPFIFSLVPSNHAGLGIGLYFGSFGGAMSLFDLLLTQITPIISAIVGAIAFLIAAVSVSLKIRQA